MCEMTFEAYLRQQAERGQYGVALIESETAIGIADWIELHRDAVPVVRCGECKYLAPGGICETFADDMIEPSASDYCSYGERRHERIHS